MRKAAADPYFNPFKHSRYSDQENCDGYTMMEKATKRARWGLVADGMTKSLSQRYEEFLERKKEDKCSKGDSDIEEFIRKRVKKYNEKEN